MAVLDQISARFDFFGMRIRSGRNRCFLLLYSFRSLLQLCFQLPLLSEQAFDIDDVFLLNFVLVQRLEPFFPAAIFRLVDLRQLLVVLLNLGRVFLGSVSHFTLLVALCLELVLNRAYFSILDNCQNG